MGPAFQTCPFLSAFPFLDPRVQPVRLHPGGGGNSWVLSFLVDPASGNSSESISIDSQGYGSCVSLLGGGFSAQSWLIAHPPCPFTGENHTRLFHMGTKG